MQYTFHDLKTKTLAELREIAKGIESEAVTGYSQMNKEHVIRAICAALKIDMHEHHRVVGVDKKRIKTEIRILKKERDALMGTGDAKRIKAVRTKIATLKHRLRKAMV
jgi:Rho termination factor, N-terminal domain.